MSETLNSLSKLIKITETLMGDDGCPWDKVQTRESLKPYLVEETYEVLEALDTNEPEKIKDELGDLLYQILFHSKLVLAIQLSTFSKKAIILGMLTIFHQLHSIGIIMTDWSN